MLRAVRASMTQIGGRTLPGPMPRNACFIIVMPCVSGKTPPTSRPTESVESMVSAQLQRDAGSEPRSRTPHNSAAAASVASDTRQ